MFCFVFVSFLFVCCFCLTLNTGKESKATLVEISVHVVFRLLDVIHEEMKLYLMFEYLDRDLKKYMDNAPPDGIPLDLVKVCTEFSQFGF
jgi:hypothetical protein